MNKTVRQGIPHELLDRESLRERMNDLAGGGMPFLFIIDYEARQGYVIEEDKIDPEFIRFQIGKEGTAASALEIQEKLLQWEVTPVSKEEYQQRFTYVVSQIRSGNSFLTNLTQPSLLTTNYSLLELYQRSSAKYKLWLKDTFLVLSPETFVTIRKGEIVSCPMKGTIDATLEQAEEQILNDQKELAEHATIVDLIRNDLSMAAGNVRVTRFRFVERIRTMQTDLLQVSSEIKGDLPADYQKRIGDILFSLLPAGSICGAPKEKTLDIIRQAEGYDRGFYTGICGYFDGLDMESAVMIRYIEQQGDHLVFKSGGGVTSQSQCDSEYNELIQKIYVPVS